ncbi:MAG: hypothetical protein ACR2IF_11395 [Terriglobales bacterium]
MEPRGALSVLVLAFALALAPPCAHSQVHLNGSREVEHALVFTASPDAPGSIDRQQVRLCLNLLTQRLHLGGAELPHIIVIHVSKRAAHAVDVAKTGIRRSASEDHPTYYELWIVGKPDPADYVVNVYTILEQHFGIVASKEEKKKVASFVLRYLTDTVDAHGGR